MKTIYSYYILHISPLTGAHMVYTPSNAWNSFEEAEEQMKEKSDKLSVVAADVVIQSVNI